MRLSRDATGMTNTSFALTPERAGGMNTAGRHSRGVKDDEAECGRRRAER